MKLKKKKNTTDRTRNGNHFYAIATRWWGTSMVVPFKKNNCYHLKKKILSLATSFLWFHVVENHHFKNKPIIYKSFIIPRRNITIALAMVKNTGSKFQALSNHCATSCALHVMPHDIAQTMGPSMKPVGKLEWLKQIWNSKWVCLKMLCTLKSNCNDHYPY